LIKAGVFRNFRGDSAAALNVVIVAAPTSIGVGLVATLSLGGDYSALGALAGLIGLIAATLVCYFTGASRFQFNAPGSAAAGLLSGLGGTIVGDAHIAEALGVSPDTLLIVALNAMMLCTALVGVMQITIGQLRLGNLIKLVPHTVITGIMNGIIVLVAFYQLPRLLGLNTDASTTFAAGLLTGINYYDLIVGVSTMLSIYMSKRWLPRLPSLLIGMLTGTLLRYLAAKAGKESPINAPIRVAAQHLLQFGTGQHCHAADYLCRLGHSNTNGVGTGVAAVSDQVQQVAGAPAVGWQCTALPCCA
jgi:SulP family sulfate permease